MTITEMLRACGDSISNEAADEIDRLRWGIEFLAQVRHIQGNAQAHMRQQLKFLDALLEGKDLRDLETVKELCR